MNSPALCFCTLVLSSGCARSTLAVFVPELELGLAVQRFRSDVTQLSARDQRVTAAFAVQLRWQSRIEASTLPASYELDPTSALSPFNDDDLECLREVAESEAELSAVLRGEP